MDKKELYEILRSAWCKETAYHEEWGVECPSLNQCCVTAMVVQDYFGGEILWAPCGEDIRHFWNLLEYGIIVDLTWEQFEYIGTPNPAGFTGIKQDRDELMNHPSVRGRYDILISKIKEYQKEVQHDRNN